MRSRRSVRDYSERTVSEESLERITGAGLLAPSGADRLPFTFVIVRDGETKEMIRTLSEAADVVFHENLAGEVGDWMKARKISTDKPFLTQAPALLVVAGDTRMPYWQESTWISIAYMALAIEAEGLASVTYTPTKTDFLNELLDIPIDFIPQVILPIGCPKEKLEPKDARPEGKVFLEKYGAE